MWKTDWKRYLPWVAVTEIVGFLAGILSREGTSMYAMMEKPPLSPPGIIFPVVWTLLYALMGIGAARIFEKENSASRKLGLNLFVVQLIVNFFWPLLFFNAQAYGFALLWLVLLWVLVLAQILVYWRLDRVAAWLQVPYLLWLTFAGYLNFGVWQLNM